MTERVSECPRLEEIGAYVTERLAEDEAKDFEEHYFSCDVCWQELEAHLAVRAALTEERALEATVPRRWRGWRPWVAAAAAAVLLLAAGVSLWRAAHVRAPERALRGDQPRLELTIETRGEELVLEWTALPGADVYRVEAFDVEGTVLFSTEVVESRLEIYLREVEPEDQKMYWRVQALDELRRSLAGSALTPVG